MPKIVYPGTFDPITLGHINLVERAAAMFDQVIIGIAHSERKKPLFSFEERRAMCEGALKHLDNVEIHAFSHLITHFAREHGAHAVLRGVRSTTDFEYELQMANMNRKISGDAFETVFLTPTPEVSFISSTLVREIASMGGDINQLVSNNVASALKQKFEG